MYANTELCACVKQNYHVCVHARDHDGGGDHDHDSAHDRGHG